MYEEVVAETAKDELLYHVYGADALPKNDGTVMIIDSNMYPNMRGDTKEMDRMAASVLRLVFGVLKGHGEVDEDLTRVWVLPL